MEFVSKRLGIGLCLGAMMLALAAGPVAGQNEDPLTSFLPQAEGIFLEKTADFPGLGNARLLVSLSQEQVDLLVQETGRADFIVIGPPEKQTILRDDGLGADQTPGDLLFSGVANVDEQELTERAAEDVANSEAAGGSVPVFDGRTFAGFQVAEPFDASGFSSGKRVQLTDPVETVTGEVASSGPQQSQAVTKAVAAGLEPENMVTPGINTFQARSLMITDVSVVQDPARTFDVCTGAGNSNGVWTFKHLITQMANQTASGINPSVFAESWLQHWTVNQTINNDPVPARAVMAGLINEWRNQSGGGNLNLDISPLRLLAIVSRLDLATTKGGGSGYGTRSGDFLDGGEARFVFGVVLPPGWADPGFFAGVPINGGPCMAERFSVIFEFRVPKCGCKDVRAWARQWVRLSTLPFPSATYNQALENITQQYAKANANPTRPNRSALGQLRTNEIALQPEWELREFQLPQSPFTFLAETTTADNPADAHNNTASFTNWVLGPVLAAINAGGFNAPIPSVPLFFSGVTPPPTNFLGAKATVPGGLFWNGPGIANVPNQNQARFRASIASCGGCHAGETQTPFVHVDPATPGLPAALSGFLTGINGVPDPAFGTPMRDFDDLARREIDIKKKARMACFRLHPVNISLVRGALLAKASGLPDDLFAGLEPMPLEEQIPVAADALDSPATSEVH